MTYPASRRLNSRPPYRQWARPYPVHALGPIITPAVLQHRENTGFSIELIGSFALGAFSFACQDLADVMKPNFGTSPGSLMVFVNAESGEGKSPAAAPYFKPILGIQAEYDRHWGSHSANIHARSAAWAKALKQLGEGLKIDSRADHQLPSLETESAMPFENERKNQPGPKVIFRNTTLRAVQESLCTRSRAAGILTTEGKELLDGALGRDLSGLNSLWQGEPLMLDRAGKAPLHCSSPRLSIVMGIHPYVFNDFMKRRGPEAMETGFLARSLYVRPMKSAGSRLLSSGVRATYAIDHCAERCGKLVRLSIEAAMADFPRSVVHFSPDAALLFGKIHHGYEVQQAPGERLFSIGSHAAKASENIARVALILYLVDGKDGSISLDVLHRAHAIVDWHVDQFLEDFGHLQAEKSPDLDALAITDGLCRARHHGFHFVKKSELVNYWCTLTNKRRFDAALKALIDDGRIKVQRHGNGTILILEDRGTYQDLFLPSAGPYFLPTSAMINRDVLGSGGDVISPFQNQTRW